MHRTWTSTTVLVLWCLAPTRSSMLPAQPVAERGVAVETPDQVQDPADRERLAQVIERLRENERLYENIDFTLRRSFRKLDEPDLPDVLLFSDTVERYVFQDRRFHFHKAGYNQTAGGDFLSFTQSTGFDGRRTLSLMISGPERHTGQPEVYAAIYDSRIPGNIAVYPHTITLGSYRANGSLSEYITQTWTGMDRPVRARYVGEADVDNFRCQTIAMRFFEVSAANGVSKPMGGFLIWLAVDRNYLPVRIENDLQSWERRITDLFEVAPGVWFPRRTEEMGYEIRDGRRAARHIWECEVLRVKTDPGYAASFFENIRIPHEAHVTEYHDGETLRSYVWEQRYPLDTEYLTLQQAESDAHLPTSLRGLKELKHLDLWGARITGPGLAALAETPRLDRLILNETPISDAGLQHLRLVPDLSHLNLNETGITDEGLAHLAPLKSLRYLGLEHCEQLTGSGLAGIDAATPLADLRLTGCPRVGDGTMEHIGRFQSLTHLHLNGTTVSDAGMSHLSGLANLEWLNVEGCTAISDAGLAHLKHLPRLRQLVVRGCPAVSDEGVASLRQALPNCRVSR